MTNHPVCSDPLFNRLAFPQEMMEYAARNALYSVYLELTTQCEGSCGYCHKSSTSTDQIFLPREKVFEILDEVRGLGARDVAFSGGDPLMHPHCLDFLQYAADKGMSKFMVLNPMSLTKKISKQICEVGCEMLSVHISTINQEVYNQVHTDPSTLEKKIRGVFNILEAGYPAEQLIAIITLTKPVAETIEETFDWFYDRVGIKYVCIACFRDEGFGKEHLDWEPSNADYKRALLYRARRMGQHWLRIGTCDFSKYFCKTYFAIHANGTIYPCPSLVDFGVGNIYEEKLTTIFERHRDLLLFNFEIKGRCGNCTNNDICFGCRANAYHYTGDIRESNPKCLMNKEGDDYWLHKKLASSKNNH